MEEDAKMAFFRKPAIFLYSFPALFHGPPVIDLDIDLVIQGMLIAR